MIKELILNVFKAVYYFLRYLVSFIIGINFFVKSDAENSEDDMMNSSNCGTTDIDDMKLKKSSYDCYDDDDMMRCANCGIKEGDDIKLKKCGACNSVRYCSVNCQKKHRPKHKKACKQRAAQLREDLLFKQPESTHLGDCPICFLPLPIHSDKFTLSTCCSQFVCVGCHYFNEKSEAKGGQSPRCPFCRKITAITDEDVDKYHVKRVEANDPVALRQRGTKHRQFGDEDRAFEYFSKAAKLGCVQAHFDLAQHYNLLGDKYQAQENFHLEEASIGGQPEARFTLGMLECEFGTHEKGVKHHIIASKLGFEPSLDALKDIYREGLVSKEDFASALRGYQDATEATKSEQRDEAERILGKNWRG